jgi:outer membrane protein assembly factor BamB
MRKYALVSAIWALTCASSAFAQFGGDWMTSGSDAQRSNWVRNDSKISPEKMGGFAVVWKMKMETKPSSRVTVTPPSLLDFYISYRGFRTLGFFGVGSDKTIGVDTDLGRLEWEKGWQTGSASTGPGCPGGLTAAVTRPMNVRYPPGPTPPGFGRGTPAKSGVGEPGEGAVTLKAALARPPQPPRPKPAKQSAGAPVEVNPFMPHIEYAVALTGDGKLHSMWVSNGNETSSAVPFLPPNANASGLIVYGNTAYVATTNSCAGVDNGVWALDMTTKQVNHWKTTAKSIAGTAGPAVTPDGTLYVGAGSELVALSPKKLETVAIHKTDGPEFTSSPVIFEYKGRNLLAAATDDGRLHLLDTASLSKALDTSAPFSGPKHQTGALASWQDPSGTRWILAPASAGGSTTGFQSNGDVTKGAIAAFKVIEKDGATKLEPAWISRDLVSPAAPIIVHGVVFALSGGVKGSSNAVLYALDPATGKELWNSGATMTAHSLSGMSAGGTRVYVATQDGMQYAFGFPTEH